ncbi:MULTISPECIES: VF530 family protein [unclassified Oceanobacter]|uniref:VF530 family protein n=1 Tax=unclassified Oceanobacter TaxID=2620260 RepID=UPI0026E2E2C5|nr:MULTISPECIES: VF530 family protein [unclassified Oceanobacter]MDO6682331.1 VF530 family protein [Oceanobacter sp. 5_MG-2023]MDP2506033.1 VF530 family protein [Oceanobacter sp. 3_MG-2023]MDP2547612.1 VF530 family protein [Oceanobacter sp. 4_MG-2023]
MSDDINYKNNPLHGVGLKQMLVELVGHYGFDILFAYLNINCFKTNPSIDASVKFLKKTTWAREKVEVFYLYQFKNLPKASSTQFALPPRDRIIPAHQQPGEPAILSLEDAERLREKRAKQAAEHGKKPRSDNKRTSNHARSSSYRHSTSTSAEPPASSAQPSSGSDSNSKPDPWAKARNKFE